MDKARNWTLEFSTAFKSLRDLYRFLEWEMEESLAQVAESYPLFVPRSLAEKIKVQGKNGVLAREFLPHLHELDHEVNVAGLVDPIGDKAYQAAPQLIHRYPSRVLFAPTTVCPVHCRYCFRKNELYQKEDLFLSAFDQTLAYLRAHSEISEVIFTGGDPLTLSNEKLSSYLDSFASVSTIKDIRFHTRYPVILPERIETGLLEVLQNATGKFRTVSLAIHANHVDEFDETSFMAIRKLHEIPVQLLSQTVLLKGVNDSVDELLRLMNLFIELKVRPYYLHHPDRVKGGMHFYASLHSGREIYGALRKFLPGWALPQYVVDVPQGEGKVSAFNPETHAYSGQLLNLHGQIVSVPEPKPLL